MREPRCPKCGTLVRPPAAEYVPIRGRWGFCRCHSCRSRLSLSATGRLNVVALQSVLVVGIVISATIAIGFALDSVPFSMPQWAEASAKAGAALAGLWVAIVLQSQLAPLVAFWALHDSTRS
jgi:hypothetical protein